MNWIRKSFRRPPSWSRPALAFGLVVLALAASACRSGAVPELEQIGRLNAPAIDEASGIAPSRREDDVYWLLNDSDNQPLLFAVNSAGRLLATVRVGGVKNFDWEDLASFTLDGKQYLLVADVGDNEGHRKECRLLVVEEPSLAGLSPATETVVPVAWSVPVHYPGKAIDCESVAVDSTSGEAYLLTKRERPGVLYRLSIRPGALEEPLRRCGVVNGLPQPTESQSALPIPRGRYTGQATSMSLSPDGHFAVVLTYTHLALFRRHDGEPWEVTLGRRPILAEHALVQGEAVCFSKDSQSVIVTGEGVGEAIYRWVWPSED